MRETIAATISSVRGSRRISLRILGQSAVGGGSGGISPQRASSSSRALGSLIARDTDDQDKPDENGNIGRGTPSDGGRHARLLCATDARPSSPIR